MNPGDTTTALTIATSDSGGGAGIQADLKTFAAHGIYGLSTFAALTAQNPDGVAAVHELPPDFLRAQLDQLVAYFDIQAAKTGMLFSAPLITVVADFIAEGQIPTVVDPVMVATSGARLLKADAITDLEAKLLPGATLVTPNLDEAAVFLGERPASPDELRAAAHVLSARWGTAVLLKGGHLQGDTLLDVLALPGGKQHEFTGQRIPGVNTHGSGCTLSAAIAANLARGLPLPDAVSRAHVYLRTALENPVRLRGQAFIGHHVPTNT